VSIIQSIILGIVEGFTEFLPISSTAHLILASHLLKIVETEFLKTFEISIQLGAIAAVVFLYRDKIFRDWNLNKKIIAAFIPTGIIGLALYKIVKNVFLVNPAISAYALLIGGIFIIIFERMYKPERAVVADLSVISYKKSIWIGICQSLAIIPGVSRAAATIIGGMIMGVERRVIVEFSFLLAIPTMAAATGLDLLKSYKLFTGADVIALGVGFVVSFIAAKLAVEFLLKFIKSHNFMAFGIYRIIVGILFLLSIR